MAKKLTDKQKSRLWQQMRSRSFHASNKLEGIEVPLVTLTRDEITARISELREHYER